MHKTLSRILALTGLLALGVVTLAPSYSPGNPVRLDPGTCVTLLLNENPATGTFSQQFYAQTSLIQPTTNLSFEFRFAANPGAFNMQIQDADTDATGHYVTVPNAGTITSCPVSAGGSFTCRVELNPWRGLYGRIYTNTQNANTVNVSAQACR